MTTPTVTTTPTLAVDLKTFLLSHAIWVVALVVALGLGHIALQDHDARVVADGQITLSEARVKDLTNQIALTTAAAVQKVQIITRIVHDVKTVPQAISAIPQLTDVPLNARVVPDNPVQVAVDALPLIAILGQAKADATNLAACTTNLQTETAIVGQKQIEIVALRRKPSFLKRVGNVAKIVGVGIGIGLLLGAHGV